MNRALSRPTRGLPHVVLAALALATILLASGCRGTSFAPAQVIVSTNGVFTLVAD